MMASVVKFRPASAAPRPAAVEMSVEIEYLHHTKPHHSDSAERRAEKQRISDDARQHEGTFEYEYSNPIERWTADDINFVVDMVRNNMPKAGQDGKAESFWPDPGDAFHADGRALQRVALHQAYTKGVMLCFSTGAGYSARIYLPATVPAGAIVPFVCGSSVFFQATIELDRRSARRHAQKMGSSVASDRGDDHAA